MAEKPYDKREIDLLHNSIIEKMTEHNKVTVQKLTSIEKQTTEHNHRMTKIEKWQERMMGASVTFALIVMPILSWALWVLVNINEQVHSAVDDALSAYNITK